MCEADLLVSLLVCRLGFTMLTFTLFDEMKQLIETTIMFTMKTQRFSSTVEPLLYDRPQNHIGMVVHV